MILIIHCRFCHFSRGPAGGGGGSGGQRRRGAVAAAGGSAAAGHPRPQGHAGGEVSQVRASTKKKTREELGLGRLR